MDQENENPEGQDYEAGNNFDTGVKFKEYPTPVYSSETPKMIQWVIKYSGGLVKNKKQATFVLLGFVALMIIITLFLIFGGTEFTSREAPPGLELSPEF